MTIDTRIKTLEDKIRQLERDIEYALTAVAAVNTRLAGIEENTRRREAKEMRGVR